MTRKQKVHDDERSDEDGGCSAALRFVDPVGPSHILVALHHLEDALPKTLHRKLARKQDCVILVEAPTEAWSAALAEAARELCPVARIITGSNPIRKKPELSLAPPRGPTFAISETRATLPPAAVAGADISIRIWPSPDSIRRTLRVLYGRSVHIERSDIAGLDLPDIGFALRPSGSAASAVSRMRRAALSRTTLAVDVATPMLGELVGYGDAIGVMKDIAKEVLIAERKPGLRLPSILVYGRPGVGKTLLVRAFARSVGLPLVQTSIGEWFRNEGHLGDVIKFARLAFDRALASAPSVFFIDEVDSLPDREAMDGRGRDWWTPLVTSVLLNIDRVREAGTGVILVGATNHLAHLDRALVRPGRFDRLIEIVGPKSFEDVAAVFRACLGDDVPGNLTAVARLTNQPTGADIVGWVAQARAVAKAHERQLELKDLVDVVAPPDTRKPESLRATARHEAAHALVGAALGLDVRSVSIIKSDQANGITTITPPNAVTLQHLDAHVVTTLAGRAADIHFGGAAASGAAIDLAQATRYVSLGLGVFGFGDELVARATLDDAISPLAYDLAFRAQVERELQRLMKRAQEMVLALERAIEILADRLLKDRVLSGDDVVATLAATTQSGGAKAVHDSSR